MQCERIEAAALPGIEPQTRVEDLCDGGAAGDVSAVRLGVIEARASELEEVDGRGERQQNCDAGTECESAQSSYLLRMRCELRHCRVLLLVVSKR